MTSIITGGGVDTTAASHWEPMRITATMAEPIITTGDPLHFDGPLAYCAMIDAKHNGIELPPISPENALDFDLPLATWRVGNHWGWCASRAHYTTAGTTAVEVRKKPPTHQYAQYTALKNHHDALGPHKARNAVHPAQLITHINWHALGDPDETTRLLTHLRHLGRMTGAGNGRILTTTVTKGTDRDAWRDRDMPGDGPTIAGIRPPYWHPTRKTTLAVA